MKKIRCMMLALLLSVCAVTMLVSCGGSNPDKLLSEYESLMSQYVSAMVEVSKNPTDTSLQEKIQKLGEQGEKVEAQIREFEDKLSAEEWAKIENRMEEIQKKVFAQTTGQVIMDYMGN